MVCGNSQEDDLDTGLLNIEEEIEDMRYYVYTYSKATHKTVAVLESGLTREDAESFCEAWGWNYDDGERSYWLDYDFE